MLPKVRSVAQFGRAAVSKTAGRGFESCHSCQKEANHVVRPGSVGDWYYCASYESGHTQRVDVELYLARPPYHRRT